VSKLYVDGSLAQRDSSIEWLFANKQPIGNYINDNSIGAGLYWNNGLLDASAGTGDVTQLYVDSSLLARDASLEYLYTKVWQTIDYVITGDGSTKDFDIIHGLDIPSSTINVFDSNNEEVFPGKFRGTNNARISFYRAPIIGKEYSVMIYGWQTNSLLLYDYLYMYDDVILY
jgi:hypothetical protein